MGKSRTGNTILQKPDHFNCTTSQKSITEICKSTECQINGRPCEIIDTPGLFDTERPQTTTLLEMARCLTMTIPGPHAFLLVHSIHEKTTEEIQETVNMIRRIFGEDVFR